MSVLSLFHPNPHERNGLRPGNLLNIHGQNKPSQRVPRLPTYKEPQPQKEQEGELKTGPPKNIDPNTKFIEYKVRASDDLDVWNIAATYGVRVEDIRRYNRRVVFDYLDNVIGETIYIPINVQEGDHVPKQPEADPKKIAEFKFVKDTGASHSEAKYYLEESEWDYESALKTFYEDISWEKTKESREKATQLEQLKSQTGTPTEKLVAALTPVPISSTPTTTTILSDDSSHHPPAYNPESSSHTLTPTTSLPPPAYNPEGQLYPTITSTSQLQSLKKPLLENTY